MFSKKGKVYIRDCIYTNIRKHMEMIQYNEDYVFLLKYECFVKGKIEKIKINNIENFLFWDNKNVKYKDVSEFINKNYDIEKINFDNIFTIIISRMKMIIVISGKLKVQNCKMLVIIMDNF